MPPHWAISTGWRGLGASGAARWPSAPAAGACTRLFIFRLNQAEESRPRWGPGGEPTRPNLEPDRAGSRRRCRCVPLPAAPRRAGAVSTRYSLPRRPFANVGVAGSSPVSCSRSSERPRLRSGAFSLALHVSLTRSDKSFPSGSSTPNHL